VQTTVSMKVGGNLARNTLEFAKMNNTDLIVIMSEQEDDFTGSFLGPYAQQIVNHSWVPVLSFKPVEEVEGHVFWERN
jgi:nucleotide-binding universal stress UspA family protein